MHASAAIHARRGIDIRHDTSPPDVCVLVHLVALFGSEESFAPVAIALQVHWQERCACQSVRIRRACGEGNQL